MVVRDRPVGCSDGVVSPGYTTLNQRKRILEYGSGYACFDCGYEFIEFGVVQSGGLNDKQGVVVALLDRSTRYFLRRHIVCEVP